MIDLVLFYIKIINNINEFYKIKISFFYIIKILNKIKKTNLHYKRE